MSLDRRASVLEFLRAGCCPQQARTVFSSKLAPPLAVAGSALVVKLSLVRTEPAQLLNETARTSACRRQVARRRILRREGEGGCHGLFLLVIDGGWGAFRPAWSVINRMCADCPHRNQRSKGGQRPNEDHKGRPRRRSAGDLRGRAVFRNDHLRAGDGVTPTDEGVKRGPKTVLPRWSPSHRACRRRCGMQLTALGQVTPLSLRYRRAWCSHEPLMITIMNPP